jgi:energy-coupling factor transporter ATP-binding protein EcfA2
MSSEADEDAVVQHLTTFVRTRGPTTGAELGQELRKRFPDFELPTDRYRSLTGLLRSRGADLAIVDEQGGDLVWDTTVADDLPGVDLPADFDALLSTTPAPPPLQRVRLEKATFRGYRSLHEVSVEFSPLTLLVGPNGAGKSNLLDAVFRTLRLTEFPPEKVFQGRHLIDRVRARGYPRDKAMRCEVKGGTFGMTWTFDNRFSFSVQTPHARLKDVHSLQGSDAGRALGPARYLKLDADEIAEPAYSGERTPYVDHRGHHVPAVLASIAATDPERFLQIQNAVTEVLPGVMGLRMPRVPVTEWVDEVRFDDDRPVRGPVHRRIVGNALEAKIAGDWIPGDQLSEGTLLVIGLQTLLGAERAPRVLLLDDLDRGLHPQAQRRLLRQLAQRTQAQDLTVIAATHSPFVLDEVDASAVRVVRLDAQGHTEVVPLTAAPAWKQWAGVMSAGEFWIHAGEGWLESS